MTIRSSRRSLSVAIALVLLASPALAQPAPPTPAIPATTSPAETARALYVEGKDLRRTGDLAGSLEKLEAAHAAYATPITALEAGRGHALLGHYKKAILLLASIPSLPVKSTESPKAVEARADATSLLTQYREHLGTMRIHVDPEAARVLVDGEEVAPDARAAWPVDPGSHLVVAELGALRTTDDVRVTDGEVRSVSLVLQPAPMLAAPGPAPDVVTAPAAPADAPRTAGALVYAGFGVAAAGTLVGTVTGIITLSRASTLKQDCRQGACPPDAHLQTAQTFGTVSTFAFVVGAAGIALGVGALVFAPSPAEARKRVRVGPWIGATAAGLEGSFR